MESRPNRVSYNFFYLQDNISLEVHLFVRVGVREVLLQLAVGQLVSRLVLAVVLGVFLDRVIDKMSKSVLQIVQRVFLGGGSNVTLSIEITFDDTVDARDQREAADVEFAALIQQRVVDVLLQDHCAVARSVARGETSDF